MARKRKNTVSFGGALAAVGCLLRIVQLIGAFFGAGFVSNKWLYIAMLCLLCGGFAVMSYEKKGKASVTAIATAAVCLLSSVMGNMSNGGDGLRIASAVFLVLTFAFAGILSIFTCGRKNIKILGGIILIVIAALCGLFAFAISAAPWVTLIVLIFAYILMGTMLLI